MTTQEIAQTLASLCNQGQFEKAQKQLYAEDAISIEPHATPDFALETKGLPAIIEKGIKFENMTEALHGVKVSDPIVAGNSIAFTMELDITMKGRERMKMSEMCVYVVKDGKITSEHFFM